MDSIHQMRWAPLNQFVRTILQFENLSNLNYFKVLLSVFLPDKGS